MLKKEREKAKRKRRAATDAGKEPQPFAPAPADTVQEKKKNVLKAKKIARMMADGSFEPPDVRAKRVRRQDEERFARLKRERNVDEATAAPNSKKHRV